MKGIKYILNSRSTLTITPSEVIFHGSYSVCSSLRNRYKGILRELTEKETEWKGYIIPTQRKEFIEYLRNHI